MIDRISTKFRNIYQLRYEHPEIACINPEYAYEYAVSVIRNKFELGEPVIFSNPKFSFWYRDFIERHSCDN